MLYQLIIQKPHLIISHVTKISNVTISTLIHNNFQLILEHLSTSLVKSETNKLYEKSLAILITAISVIFCVGFSCVEFSCVMFSCVELSCVAFSCVEFSGNPVPAVLLCVVQLSLHVRTSLELYLLSPSQSSLLNAAELFKKRFSLVVVISLEFEY